MHHRIPRIIGALTGAVSLTVGLLVPVAVASPAPLTVSPRENLSPPKVSWSNPPTTINLGGFHMTATNTGTSNIAQLYLTETGGAAVYAYAIDAPGSYSCSPQYVITGTLAPLNCSFGQLNPGQSVDITVALISPSSGNTWPFDFEWSTTGYVLGGNQSHGDLWSFSGSIPLVSGSGNSAGTFVWDSSQQSLSTDQTISKSHTQSAAASLNSGQDVGIPFFVSSDATLNTAQTVDCASSETIVGNWTQVNANNDITLNGQLHTTIVIYHGPSPNQVNGVCWVHYVYTIDPSTSQPYGWIGTDLLNAPYADGGALCSTDPPLDTDPALVDTSLGACIELGHDGPNLVIQVYSYNNGFMGTY